MAPNYSKFINKNNALASAGILAVAWYLAARRKNRGLKVNR